MHTHQMNNYVCYIQTHIQANKYAYINRVHTQTHTHTHTHTHKHRPTHLNLGVSVLLSRHLTRLETTLMGVHTFNK